MMPNLTTFFGKICVDCLQEHSFSLFLYFYFCSFFLARCELLLLFINNKWNRFAGTVGAILTCPLEVVKTRLQSSSSTFYPSTSTELSQKLSGTTLPYRGTTQKRDICTSILQKRSQVSGSMITTEKWNYFSGSRCYFFYIVMDPHTNFFHSF